MNYKFTWDTVPNFQSCVCVCCVPVYIHTCLQALQISEVALPEYVNIKCKPFRLYYPITCHLLHFIDKVTVTNTFWNTAA